MLQSIRKGRIMDESQYAGQHQIDNKPDKIVNDEKIKSLLDAQIVTVFQEISPYNDKSSSEIPVKRDKNIPEYDRPKEPTDKSPASTKKTQWWSLSFVSWLMITVIVYSIFHLGYNTFFFGSKDKGYTVARPVIEPKGQPAYQTKSIEAIHVGERTVGTNPQGAEFDKDLNEIFQTIPHHAYTFTMKKSDGTICDFTLLRPEEWLPAQRIVYRSKVGVKDTDAPISSDTHDTEVYISLPEMGVDGFAQLSQTENNIKIQEGQGNVVTGTFHHVANNVIELQIEGQEKSIGCTDNHPFWSVDREDFVEAGKLMPGERVRLVNGETKRIVQKLHHPGPQDVYNLEIFNEHVYHVTNDGILVHNMCLDVSDFNIFLKKTKLGGGINSPTNIQLYENRFMTVQEYLGKFRKGSVKAVVPDGAMQMTVQDALRAGHVDGVDIRKLLNNHRDKFQK